VDDAIRLVSEENKDDPITENKQHPVKEESQPWLLLLTTTNQVFENKNNNVACNQS
jgi:hypothetical protein